MRPDTERFCVERTLPMREDMSGYRIEREYIEQSINRELWRGINNKVSDGGEYIIKIAPKEAEYSEIPDCMIVRGYAEITPLVRCKDCAQKEHEELDMVYCPRVYASWVPEDFYCGAGVRK